MTIIYSCIARGTTILCSHGYQQGSGNLETAAESVLPSVPTRNNGKTSVTANNFKFHCIVENGIIFMCTAKAGFAAQACFAFLTEIKDQFHNNNYSSRVVSASSHEFDSEFNNILAKQMDKFSRPDQLGQLQGQVKEVTGVMATNIESVIQRGERLDDLMDKTDDLEAASATFQRTAKKIKKKYWWKNTKMTIIVVIVVILILTGVILAIMGGAGVFDGSSDKTTAAPPATTPKSTG